MNGGIDLFVIPSLRIHHCVLALALLMPGVFANYAHIAVTADDLAFSANALYRCSHFHFYDSFLEAKRAGPLRLGSVSDAATSQIVGREFHGYLISRENADKVHAHFSRYMSKNAMTVGQFHSEHGIGKGFNHRSFHFNSVLFGHALGDLLDMICRELSIILPDFHLVKHFPVNSVFPVRFR